MKTITLALILSAFACQNILAADASPNIDIKKIKKIICTTDMTYPLDNPSQVTPTNGDVDLKVFTRHPEKDSKLGTAFMLAQYKNDPSGGLSLFGGIEFPFFFDRVKNDSVKYSDTLAKAIGNLDILSDPSGSGYPGSGYLNDKGIVSKMRCIFSQI